MADLNVAIKGVKIASLALNIPTPEVYLYQKMNFLMLKLLVFLLTMTTKLYLMKSGLLTPPK